MDGDQWFHVKRMDCATQLHFHKSTSLYCSTVHKTSAVLRTVASMITLYCENLNCYRTNEIIDRNINSAAYLNVQKRCKTFTRFEPDQVTHKSNINQSKSLNLARPLNLCKLVDRLAQFYGISKQATTKI